MKTGESPEHKDSVDIT